MARLGLAAGLIGFGAVVFLGVRQRVEPVAARGVDRSDPESVIETTNAEITQSAGELHDYTLTAGRQMTYDDGSSKSVEGVELEVAEQADRESFVLTGREAQTDGNESNVTAIGDVRLTVADGLGAHTERATYARTQATVHMPGPTTLTRQGVNASGRDVVYERDRSFVTLGQAAHVRLTGEATQADIDIWSAHARLAHTDGYMYFDGGSTVTTGSYRLDADDVTVRFGEDETALEGLELRGNASIRSMEPTSGGLQEMRADEMNLAFDETTRTLERVVLAGAAVIELVGRDDAEGARVRAPSIDVSIASDGVNVTGLQARRGVTLEFPPTADGMRQEITASRFNSRGTGLDSVAFHRQVQYREWPAQADSSDSTGRVIRADRLIAGVEPGLGALLAARFRWNVRFEDGSRNATADDAVYDAAAGFLTLNTRIGARRPTVNDETSRIDATDMILSLDNSTIEATGDVRSEMMVGDGATGKKLPALLDPEQQVFATAAGLQYDPDTGRMEYTGGARLWQGETSFEGDTLALDDETGGLTANGGVKTRLQLMRVNEATGESDVSLTRAEADAFTYDDSARHALYDGNAVFLSETGDMQAELIEFFLEDDGRTLNRLEVTGEVTLRLDGRWATGGRLVYYEAEGRYEMEGTPVEIVEEIEPEESSAATPPAAPETPPPPPSCTTTRGRALTFYRSGDILSVDGREDVRTESSSGICEPVRF